MAFMEKEITKKMTWFQVQTDDITRGLVSYPSNQFTKVEVSKLENVNMEDVKEIKGYGGRMSAPGYLDCTDWAVYDSSEAAEADLDEYYGDEDEADADEESE